MKSLEWYTLEAAWQRLVPLAAKAGVPKEALDPEAFEKWLYGMSPFNTQREENAE